MSTLKLLREYLKTHRKATYPELRKHCEQYGRMTNETAFSLNYMLKRNEVTRTGERRSYVYEYVRQETEAAPAIVNASRFDQLLRGVRG